MEQFAECQKSNLNNRSVWSVAAILSVLPVLLVSTLCSHYNQPEQLLGLFLVEWIVVLMVWRFLCPWLGYKSVILAAVPFILSFLVAAIVLHENINVYKAVWTWSDDVWYLNNAGVVADSLHSSGWNLAKAWSDLISVGEVGGWTLAGWPFILGLVSSCVTADASLNILHAIALSLNATFLTIVLALIFFVLKEKAQRFPYMMLFCFLILLGDPIVYAAYSLKESMLQLSLMLSFVLCLKLSKKFQVKQIIFWLVGMVGIATTRPAYIPLLLIIFFKGFIDRLHFGIFLKVLASFLLIVLVGSQIIGFQIREYSIGDLSKLNMLEGESGLAISVYRIPLIGPVLYYAISPIPPLFWKIQSVERIGTTIIRSVGSVAWFFTACYVLFKIVRKRRLLKDKLFVAAAIMVFCLFFAVLLTRNDPRYKQPTNFYLSLMLYLVWYDRRIKLIETFPNASKEIGIK